MKIKFPTSNQRHFVGLTSKLFYLFFSENIYLQTLICVSVIVCVVSHTRMWAWECFYNRFTNNFFFPRKLKRLNLGGNHLTAIPQKALSIFDTLKKLEVQENRIETIKEGDFEGLRNLDSLILAHNKMRQIPANVFSHLKQLNSLELEGNSITYVDKDAFSGLEGKLMN